MVCKLKILGILGLLLLPGFANSTVIIDYPADDGMVYEFESFINVTSTASSTYPNFHESYHAAVVTVDGVQQESQKWYGADFVNHGIYRTDFGESNMTHEILVEVFNRSRSLGTDSLKIKVAESPDYAAVKLDGKTYKQQFPEPPKGTPEN